SLVTVLIGNGDGTFRAGSSIGSGTGGRSFVTADFNRDGNLDIAVAGGLTVFLGKGNGTFSAGVTLTSVAVATVVSGDFDGDGVTDLAVNSASPGSSQFIRIYSGRGDGTFQTPLKDILVPATDTQGAGFLISGEWTGDGRADLALIDIS